MLWKLSITTAPEAEDAVAQLLESVHAELSLHRDKEPGRANGPLSLALSPSEGERELPVARGRRLMESAFGQPVCSYTDAETGLVVVSVFVQTKPDWSRAGRAELVSGLKRIAGHGLNIGPGKVVLERIRREDWAESWKLHFKPVLIGSALLLKPSWSRRLARKGQVEVVLDPGLSFGTGRHPTTAFCLRQLVVRRRAGEAQSCLDVGAGSGILAIAAAKLGYAPVEAFDSDPEALGIARANARRNGVAARIRFRRQDLTQLPRRGARQYSLICANLSSSLLMSERERILARLRADGVLVIAGVLRGEFAEVQRRFESAGLRLVGSHAHNEWRSGAFCWRSVGGPPAGGASG